MPTVCTKSVHRFSDPAIEAGRGPARHSHAGAAGLDKFKSPPGPARQRTTISLYHRPGAGISARQQPAQHQRHAGGVPPAVEPQLDGDGRDTKTTRDRRQRLASGSPGFQPRHELRASPHEKKGVIASGHS
jgi:hypothetical protein